MRVTRVEAKNASIWDPFSIRSWRPSNCRPSSEMCLSRKVMRSSGNSRIGDHAALAILPDGELLPLSNTAVIDTKRLAEILNQRERSRTGVRRVALGDTY